MPKARPAPRLPGALVPRVLLPAGLLSAAMLSSVPLAPAQAADPPPPPLATQQMLPATDTLRVFGRDVKSASGTVVAQIVNVLVNEAGEPRAAILDYGGFLGVGRRRIAVTWETLSFTPDGITFQARTVNVGNRSMGKAEIVDGLKPGDRIVVSGAFMVKSEMLKGTMGDG